MAGDRETILTKYARLSFPTLAKAREYKKGDKAKFSATLLFPKPELVTGVRADGKPVSPWKDVSKHDLTELRGVVDRFVADTWPKSDKRPKLRLPFKDGDDEKWDGYEGNIFVRTTSIRMPLLIDAQKNEISGDDIEKLFYPGCWVRASVSPFDYNETGNVGVSLGLRALQFIRHDETFSGKVTADSFDAIPEADIAPDDLDGLE